MYVCSVLYFIVAHTYRLGYGKKAEASKHYIKKKKKLNTVSTNVMEEKN